MPDVEQIALEGVFALSKYRVKYKKKEEARYISHLDFVRTITRTLKRAEIPIKYSQGFNPHIIMTVGLPLSVGVLSDAEYMDVELYEDMDENKLVCDINNSIPMGLEILSARKLEEGDIPLSKISLAKYLVGVECTGECDLDLLMKNASLEVDKKTKKGITLTDIKPMIKNICYLYQKEGKNYYEMLLSAGNIQNLKPETVVLAMEKYSDNFKSEFVCVKRLEMYFDENMPIN